MPRAFGLLAWVVLWPAAAAIGCSPYVQRGQTLYHQGRYIEAAEVFELTEGRLPESPGDVCASYGLFRGLTFLRLGDLPSARRWLGYAYALERRAPGTLSDDEQALLDRGWQELEKRSPERVAAPPERVAVSARAAMPHGSAPSTDGKGRVASE